MIQKEGIDTRILRAIVLATVICAALALTIFLIYYLIKDYTECIALAILSSLALRPIKAWSLTQLKELAMAQQWFPKLRQAWVISIGKALFQFNYKDSSHSLLDTTRNFDGFWLSISAFFLYFLSVKIRFSSVFVVLIVALLLDLVLRFGTDLFACLMRLAGWESGDNAHKAEKCSSFLSILILFFALLGAFSLVVAIVIPTGLEIKEKSGDIIEGFGKLGLNFTTEGITNTVTRYVEQAGGLRSWTGFESMSKNLTETDQIYRVYADRLKELPMVGVFLKENLMKLEGTLKYFGIPFDNAVNFVIENLDEISFYGFELGKVVWSVFVSSTASLFSSFFDFIYSICLYLSLVFFLMTREYSIITSILSIIPISQELHRKIETDLTMNVVQIFKTIIKIAVTYALATYVLFDSLDLPFKHTAAMFTGLVGFVQLIDPWVVTLPWVISLVYWGMYYRAATVLGVEYFLLGYFYKDIYSHTVTGLNVTILTLASVFGLSNFGVLGVLYGPLIAGLINVFLSAISGLNSKP